MKPIMPSAMHAIVMVGIPGAGKTTFAARFADTFNAPFFNLPKIKEDLDLDAKQMAQFFELTMQEISKTGQTVIIEGFADTKKERESLGQILERLKFKVMFVWVQTDTNESLKRATLKRAGGSQLTEKEFDNLLDIFDPPEPKEKAVVISGRHAYPTQLKVVLRHMASTVVRPGLSSNATADRQVRPRARNVVSVSSVKNMPKR